VALPASAIKDDPQSSGVVFDRRLKDVPSRGIPRRRATAIEACAELKRECDARRFENLSELDALVIESDLAR
jgi:hypothetical protein